LTTGQVRLDSWQAGRQPRTIEYVFRARAWVDENDDDIPDPNELDISPANAAFKVVPATSEEEYVEDRASEDLQPVKSVEDL
jgi:hypothetical protein